MPHPVPAPPTVPGVQFRSVPKHTNYLVSDDGKVWIARRVAWREMKTHKDAKGREVVWLMNDMNGDGEDFVVSKLVQQIFGGD